MGVIGHVMRMALNIISKVVLHWTPPGKSTLQRTEAGDGDKLLMPYVP
jgi:hypothetical protein